MIPAVPVGGVVAKGEAEIGFQQISELRPVKGIGIVGPLPAGAQRPTLFAAGIPAISKQPDEARTLIQWLASPARYPVIGKTSLEPPFVGDYRTFLIASEVRGFQELREFAA
jgi:molybdate transport system substrate-binding protein